MAKLNLAQIRYIDNELLKLDFKFVDIRYEMTDHIASVLEEKEGKFKDNLKEYFIMNKLRLIRQYKKTRRLAIVSAIKYYLQTMINPVVFISAVVWALLLYFGSILFIDDNEIILFGNGVWVTMILPFFWLAKNNRQLSVMRPMALIQTFLYFTFQAIIIVTYTTHDKALRILSLRLAISVIAALMLVLLVSLYKCRKVYVKKYI